MKRLYALSILAIHPVTGVARHCADCFETEEDSPEVLMAKFRAVAIYHPAFPAWEGWIRHDVRFLDITEKRRSS